MKLKHLLVIGVLAAFLVGCGAGETKVEQVGSTTTEPAADSMEGSIKSNPNIPPAAKQALGTQ